jgi:hypothetical protein
MRKVERGEILDHVTYGERREAIRDEAMRHKDARRVVLADGLLTFLFENPVTVRYQVLEMVRAERIVREADIQHELDTYNELLGGSGELGVTLLIAVVDPVERPARLAALRTLPDHVFAVLEDGARVAARYDARQVGEERLSSVQFLKFDTGGRVPVALRVEHPALAAEGVLAPAQRAALAADLA